jgi:orotate phosphoribosyltransferase
MHEKLVSELSMRRGHFLLESGHHGDLWLDLDALLLRPGRVTQFTQELGRRLIQYNIQAVCGPLLGGAFVAQLIAEQLNVEFYYTERVAAPEGGALFGVVYQLPESVSALAQGNRVAVVDDAIYAGSATRATIGCLEACQAVPVAIGALLLLGSSASEYAASKRLPLETIAYLPSQTWIPSECPLCASGQPLERLRARQ